MAQQRARNGDHRVPVIARLAVRICGETWFGDPWTRTVSRAAAWLAARDPGEVSALLADAAPGQGRLFPDPDDLTALAGRLLVATGLVPPRPVGDVGDLADRLADHLARHGRRLLDDVALAEAADLHPGGAGVLAAAGPEALREALAARLARPEEVVGHPRIRPLLGARAGPGQLAAANRVLLDPAPAARVLVEALTRHPDPDEAARAAALRAAVGAEVMGTGPLLAPPPPRAAEAVRRLAADPDFPGTGPAADLAATLGASEHYLQGYRGYVHGLALRDLVWEAVADASGLPHHRRQPEENAALLAELLGAEAGAELLRRTHPRLAAMCRGARRLRHHPRTAPDRPAPEWKEVLDAVCGHLARHGSLPARDHLPPRLVAAAESTSRLRWPELTDLLAEAWDVPRPSRTAAEAALDRLLAEAWPGTPVATEWSWEDASGRRFRSDARLELAVDQEGTLFPEPVTVEVLLEADGEQHFREVPVWRRSLAEVREADAAKAAAVRERRSTSGPCLLVALHHRVLSGTTLTGADLAALVTRAAAAGWWWVFVRPREGDGSDALRAHPAGWRPTRLCPVGNGAEALILTREQ